MTDLPASSSLFGEHPQRARLVNELHARPFQPAPAPGRMMQLAFKQTKDAAERDIEKDRAHLVAFLDRYGSPHPAPDARQHVVDLDRFRLKWELHTEFTTYTIFEDGPTDQLFSTHLINHFDPNWLNAAPGKVVAAVQCELVDALGAASDEDAVSEDIRRHFSASSLAASHLLDGNAIAVGDFRIHEGGFSRFALVMTGQTGSRRIGRAAQRLIEIEVYRAMAMLALPIAQRVSRRLNAVERELSELAGRASAEEAQRIGDVELLESLMTLSTEIEMLSAGSAFRFEAAAAYNSIVVERLTALREVSALGRQTFREFMVRRYDPAIRTVQAAKSRLLALSDRAARIAELLRTRVNVNLEAQNKTLLESMDRRAAVQLRLQETVEGFSVVAISYYAIGISGYVVDPIAERAGIGKDGLLAGMSIAIVVGVWWFIRRIRTRLTSGR